MQPPRQGTGASDVAVSLVVVTYNRAAELLGLLRSLEDDLARPDVEVILVDDGSTDATIDRVTPVFGPLGDRGRIIAQGREGPGTGRNRGIAAARGRLVVFVDTDCLAHPGWLDALRAPFADAEVGIAGGPDRSMPDDPLLARLVDYLMTGFLVTGGVRGAARTRGGRYHPRSFNMAVRREAAVAVGGFPTIWYGEDVLLSWRVTRLGLRAAFAPDAWVYHRRRTTLSGWARQLYRMGRARLWMGRHDPGLLDPLYLVPLAEWTAGLGAVAAIAAGGAPRVVGVTVVVAAAAFLAAIGIDGWRRVRHLVALVATPLMFLMREAAYALGSLAGMTTRIPDLDGALGRVMPRAQGGEAEAP